MGAQDAESLAVWRESVILDRVRRKVREQVARSAIQRLKPQVFRAVFLNDVADRFAVWCGIVALSQFVDPARAAGLRLRSRNQSDDRDLHVLDATLQGYERRNSTASSRARLIPETPRSMPGIAASLTTSESPPSTGVRMIRAFTRSL